MIDEETGEIVTPFMRSAFNYDMDAVSRETGIVNTDPTMTQQQFREEVDINTIVNRFGLTGEMPDNFRAPEFGDFSEVMDYQSAQNALLAAQSAFMEMPAEVRAEFDNDPQKLMEFVSDRKNLDRARELKIVPPEEVPREPMAVRVVAEPGEPAKA